MKYHVVFFSALLFSMPAFGEWAHVFHKTPNKIELRRAQEENRFFFSQSNVCPYSQLLLSWNAKRPKKGHFTFFVKAKNYHTNRWGAWHRMLEWGADVQRSFSSKSDGFTRYVHVRLETEELLLSDAFRIKVVGAKGADLADLRHLTVTTANMRNFQPEAVTENLATLPTVVIKNVSKISQLSLDHAEKNRICSPVSCTMVSDYWGKRKHDPAEFARQSFDAGLNTYGSWPFNMAHSYEQCREKVRCYNTRLNSFADIHAQLRKNHPVIVSIRGRLEGAPRSYPHGHLLAVVGYDGKTKEVVCHDPAKEGHANVEQRYRLQDFMKSWEASRRLTYLFERV